MLDPRPAPLSDQTVLGLGSGGRYDVTFTMPNYPVKLSDDKNAVKPV
ncbi:hypothetical protein G8C92_25865 [Paenibacillus donghaensis]|nr:hypothetical protein [Paenibacillus donghaensis]MBE9917444.1 hypothetical protein [Paenibacillus donghaensis]